MAGRFLVGALATSSLAFQMVTGQILSHETPSQHVLPAIPPESNELNGKPSLQPKSHEFKLRHMFHHGTYKYPELHRRLDVDPDRVEVLMVDGDSSSPITSLRARSSPLKIQRLVDRSYATISNILEIGRTSGRPADLPASAWTIDEVQGPDVTDKESVLTFARMTADAYITGPDDSEWQDVGGGFNYTEDFGWESDGLRGHIFADTENSTVVIGLKGTSPAVFDGSETTTNDKLNDNLFFSCCCGQGGHYLWRQVCDCQTDTYTCNSTCLVKAMREKNRYYWAAQDLYQNVTALYPNSDVWLAGHSLGGAMSSLLGMTYGLPTITYEAIPEAMPAARLNLPVPPGYRIGAHQDRELTGIHHFGHTADPVYMGKCNGVSSFCTLAGYAMQSQCHSGKRCVYDTVEDFGWRVGLGTHKILSVIRDVLEVYNDTAECHTDEGCTDCFNWSYFESNGSETTTTSTYSSTSSTRTRTETCRTPGWFSCLDSSTTTTTTTTTSTSSSSTSTCKTWGWFSCLDETSTTTTTTTTSSTPASPSATTTPTSQPTGSTSSSSSSSTTCTSKGWFGGCLDPTVTSTITTTTKVKPAATSTSASATSTEARAGKKTQNCSSRYWWGGCKERNSASKVDL